MVSRLESLIDPSDRALIKGAKGAFRQLRRGKALQVAFDVWSLQELAGAPPDWTRVLAAVRRIPNVEALLFRYTPGSGRRCRTRHRSGGCWRGCPG